MKTIHTVDEQDVLAATAERGKPRSPLARYIKAAMQHATYEQLAPNQSYSGTIPGLPGLHSQAATEDASRIELRDRLETWLLQRLDAQLPIPPVDGIPLIAWIWMKRGT
jgi:predicted RNase H-like HicB family nuclease